MENSASYEDRDRYLFVKVHGWPETIGLHEGMAALRERASGRGYTRILIDAREVAPIGFGIERFRIGKAFADTFRPPFRVAVLYRPEWIGKFAENTAVNRGAQVHSSGDESEAIRWLFAEETGRFRGEKTE